MFYQLHYFVTYRSLLRGRSIKKNGNFPTSSKAVKKMEKSLEQERGEGCH